MGKCSQMNKAIFFDRTFSDVKPKEVFWYINSNNLVEISANLSSAKKELDLKIGTPIKVIN